MLPEHVLLHTIIHIVLSLNYPTLSSIFNSPHLLCYYFYIQWMQCTDLVTVFVLKAQSA